MVVADVLGHAFLHGGLPEEFACFSEVCHEGGGLLYVISVFGEGLCGWIGTVHLLGEVDVMRLLPGEETARIGGRLTCPWVGHLHPADTLEPLSLSYLSCHRGSGVVIPVEHLCHDLRLVP